LHHPDTAAFDAAKPIDGPTVSRNSITLLVVNIQEDPRAFDSGGRA
jgi:hypothetical protein